MWGRVNLATNHTLWGRIEKRDSGFFEKVEKHFTLLPHNVNFRLTFPHNARLTLPHNVWH